MKRSWLLAVLVAVGAGSLSANTIVSNCTLNALSVTCYDAGTFSFADSLDWGAAVSGTGQSGFGTALQSPGNSDNPHNVSITPWIARSVGGINIYAALGSGFSGSPLLTRVDNTYYGYGPVQIPDDGVVNRYQVLDDLVPNHMYAYPGHFGANPTSLDPYQLGDHLLGSINGQGPIVLSFGTGLKRVGFEIASYSEDANANFSATLMAYNGATLLDTYSMDVTGGGGICASLDPSSPNSHHPVACNDAAFIALDAGTQTITSITVITTDAAGFFIDRLFLEAPAGVVVPEPAALLMVGCGLAALGLLAKKRAGRSR